MFLASVFVVSEFVVAAFQVENFVVDARVVSLIALQVVELLPQLCDEAVLFIRAKFDATFALL